MPPFNLSRTLPLARAQLIKIPRFSISTPIIFTHELVSSSRPNRQTMTAYERLRLLRHDSASTGHDLQYKMQQLEVRLDMRDGKLNTIVDKLRALDTRAWTTDHKIVSLRCELSSMDSRLSSEVSGIKHEIWKLSLDMPRTTYQASRSCSVDESKTQVILWVTAAVFLLVVCVLAELMSQRDRLDKQERERKVNGEIRREK